MKFSELYRLLEKDGWYIERTMNHYLYVHPVKKGKYLSGNIVLRKWQQGH